MTATEKLAKATREALNSSEYVASMIREAGENAEQVKEAMYNMLFATALMNDDGLRVEVEGELFEAVMARIA